MDTDNQLDNISHSPELDELRNEYKRLIRQPLTQRTKGLPYPAITVFFLSPAMLLASLLVSFLVIKFHNNLLTILALIFSAWLTFIFPERYFSLPQRTTRNSFRRYPKVKSTAMALNKPSGRFLRDVPILRINGRTLFLLRYGKKQSILQNSASEITGMVIINEQGQLIENEEILKKAFRTIVMADICGHQTQIRYTRIRSYSSKTLRRTLPRVERILKKAEKIFEEHGFGSHYRQLMSQLPFLCEALKSGITIHDGDNNFRRSVGWSFALEFFYEDALKYENLCQSYVNFMEAAYGAQLVTIIQIASELSKIMEEDGQWRNRRKIIYALKELYKISNAIKNWIFTYSTLGKLSGKDWENYHYMLNRARSLGLQIIQE